MNNVGQIRWHESLEIFTIPSIDVESTLASIQVKLTEIETPLKDMVVCANNMVQRSQAISDEVSCDEWIWKTLIVMSSFQHIES